MHNYAFPLSPLPAVKNKAKQKQGVTIKNTYSPPLLKVYKSTL